MEAGGKWLCLPLFLMLSPPEAPNPGSPGLPRTGLSGSGRRTTRQGALTDGGRLEPVPPLRNAVLIPCIHLQFRSSGPSALLETVIQGGKDPIASLLPLGKDVTRHPGPGNASPSAPAVLLPGLCSLLIFMLPTAGSTQGPSFQGVGLAQSTATAAQRNPGPLSTRGP